MTTRTEQSTKRVRAYVGGQLVADTIRPVLVWEVPYYPTYHLPADDVRMDLVPAGAATEVDGLVRLEWSAMDAWFEEDEQVYVHPRDPYTRVDCLPSSRHVEVSVDGEVVADSGHPTILFETGLPPRYYLPLVDLRMGLLRPSSRVTRCPYKGEASYWSVEVGGRLHEDLVWTYRTPLPESIRVAGMACFFNERVDLVVDGVAQDRPRTKFS
jgi:uncharacterized protein (DUF427 family)